VKREPESTIESREKNITGKKSEERRARTIAYEGGTNHISKRKMGTYIKAGGEGQ